MNTEIRTLGQPPKCVNKHHYTPLVHYILNVGELLSDQRYQNQTQEGGQGGIGSYQ